MTDIAKELYVSVPTASKILQDLQDGGCIQSQGKLEIGVGRFPLLFGLNPDGGYFIGVDIKRSGMHIGLINLQSELICADYDLPYTLENTPRPSRRSAVRSVASSRATASSPRRS